MTRIAALLVAVAVAGGCADATAETPLTTPEPLAASVEERGIRLTVALPTAPVRFGRTWADVVVENDEPGAVDWVPSFCDGVAQLTIDSTPAFLEGRAWPERLGMFKEWATRNTYLTGEFLPDVELPPGGDGVCDGRLGMRTLPGGATLQGRSAWDGLLGFQSAIEVPAPPGPTTLVVSFGLIGPRVGDRPAEPDLSRPVVATIETSILPRPGESPLSPGLAIDAALADPVFGAWVQAGHEDTWSHVSVSMERDTWLIQLIRRKHGDRPETGWLGEIRIGPRGEVVARRTDVRTPGNCPDPTVC